MRVKWWGTGLVVLVLLILGLMLPLVDKALGSGGTALAAGTVIAVGTERAGGVRPVTFTVPAAGWVLDEARSSLTNNAELSRDEVVFNLNVVIPLGSLDDRRLWNGFGRIVSMGGGELRGGPRPITTAHGMDGLTGPLSGHGRIGSGTVFARDDLGAEITASGPPEAYRRLAGQVRAMVLSVEFAP